jgi:sugar-specific transcriptional regulator TrmB
MVRPSFDSPTIYAAIDLETALESIISQHMSELREMEARKRELHELKELLFTLWLCMRFLAFAY